MCMASVDRQSIIAPALDKKRSRDDDPPLPPDLDLEPLFKRPCPDFPPSVSTASQLGFLEELYEFENSLDAGAVESATQEELIAEIMRSLEKAIGNDDETSVPESGADGEPSQFLRPLQIDGHEVKDLPSVAPNGSSDSALQDGLFMGSPPSLITSSETLAHPIGNDWSSIEARYSDFETSFSMLPIAAGMYSQVPGIWVDGSFDQLGDAFTDYSRDYCDLISLDSV